MEEKKNKKASNVNIKSNKYGMSVFLNPNISFEQLKDEVSKKFLESKNFFKGSCMVLSFSGRALTQNEEIELVNVIEDASEMSIPYIMDNNSKIEEKMKCALQKVPSQKEVPNINDVKFIKGTVRSGQTLNAETSIVVLGDVNPGATLTSKGNVIVLGALKGTVCVGSNGNDKAFVAALSMDPMQIRIADYIARNSDDSKTKRKNDNEPKIAYVDNGNIYVEAITKEALENIKLD